MNLVQNITSDPRQQQTLLLDDGSRVDITFYFRLSQIGWFLQSLSYNGNTYNEIRVVTSPNFIHMLRNVLPFGLGCYTKDNNDPTQLKDFSTGYASLYVLSAAETLQYAEFLSGQVK